MKKKFLLAALLLSSLFFAPSVFADVEILPAINDVTIEPGTQKYTVVLKNTSPQQVKGTLHITEYEGLDEKWTEIKNWLAFLDEKGEKVPELNFELSPNSEKIIKYNLTVPEENLPEGAQYATFVVDSETNHAEATIYGENQATAIHSGEVIETTIPSFSAGGNVKGTIKIKNTGNTSLTITEELEIQSLYEKVQTVLNENVTLLPGEIKTIEQEWRETPAAGIFNATYNIYILGEKTTISGTVAVIPVWMILIIVAGAIALIGLIYIAIRKLAKK